MDTKALGFMPLLMEIYLVVLLLEGAEAITEQKNNDKNLTLTEDMAPKNVDGEEKVQWPSKHVEFFIHILHDHVKKGDLQASTFKTKVWSEISEELLAKCGKKCTVKQLKYKFNRLRIAHREFSDLIEHTGFGWDPNANTVTASEDVWASYIKSKPRAKQYRTQGLVHYQLLGEIFNTTTATGQLRYASNQLPPNSDEERELENNFLNTGVHIDVDLDDDGFNQETDHGKGKRKSVTATPPERRSKKWDKMESYLEVCSEVMSQRLQTIQKEKSVEASSTSKEMYSIEECIGIVEEMGDIDNDTFNKMLEKIVLIEWRKIFVTMSDARRRSWLASL
ncbi:unnamed protein product [Prunus armeniaca]|uniref:Myb/SANT-like domain-containing protein n=1 Tax=Prunus armeniaca TaxID=36596 RepID=A0A6J5XSA5_PRUAR|nr:unnamed protein product [Prunus armeniaca]